VLPPRLGYPLAGFIADRVAERRHTGIVRAVRANQWVCRGESLEGEALDQAVRETFRQSARSIFGLYRGLQHPQAAQESILWDPEPTRLLINRPEFDDRGLVIASLHLGNFDLMLHMLSIRGIKPWVLTLPNPRGARRVEFESRKRAGAMLLPGSVIAIRQALRHLQRGGMVATGIDRPISHPGIRPRFFGRPAALPLHYTFLALKAKVPIMVLATIRQPDGTHRIHSSGLLEMEPHADRGTEMRRNAERVLRIAEEYIRKAPSQWSVSLPVWPEVLENVPA
jgi:lauroyl/myristoyl acyltransferase